MGIGALHLLALVFTFGLFFAWRRRYPDKYRALWADNTRNAVVIAPALAVGMTFNVALIGGYFYMPWMRENTQALMPYALGGWSLIFLYSMSTALRLQKRHLEQGFDVHSMHFGWLLIPFALGMTAVAGASVAALARSPTVAGTAFILSLIPFTMAGFLLLVKVISVFRSQYLKGLPQKIEFLPSFFIVIPIVTLLAISVFRFGHFFEHQLGGQLPGAFFAAVTASAWAFELWYVGLGLFLLGSYFRKHPFSMQYFDESQWGLICPMVAMSMLGAFVYKTLLPTPVMMGAVLGFLVLDVVVLTWIAVRQYRALMQRAREPALDPAAESAIQST